MIDSIINLISKPGFVYCVCIFLFILLIVQRIRFTKKIRSLRKDTINRSKSVISGQIAEQFAPFMPDFPSNPNDAHFIGRPIDYICFSGLTQTDKVDEILLVEVKSGTSSLSNREKEVRKAVTDGRVRYVEYRV